MALLFSGAAFGQVNTLPSAPCDSINLRLELAGEQMHKAAWGRSASVFVGAFAGAFAIAANDRSQKYYSQAAAIVLAGVSVGGFLGFQVKGAGHDRKAAALLRFH